jgi:hypothetical protein
MKFRNLKAEEIDVRVGQVYDGKCTLLLYKDARADMDILDETIGAENWQRKHYAVKDNMYCSVGIKCGADWVWKDDCGTESNTEKEKGEASDSFKRACVNWGIGRELYTAPKIFVDCVTTKDKKIENLTNFEVQSIEYCGAEKRIKSVVIKAYDKDTRTTVIVFPKGYCAQKPQQPQPLETPKKKADVVYRVDDEIANDIYFQASEKGWDEKTVNAVIKKTYGTDNIFELTLTQGNELLRRIREAVKK